jgi:hypothetical protein
VLALLLGGCGPTRFEAELKVPPPLVSRIPIVVGVYVPEEFRTRVYEEKRRDYSISVAIGKAQSDGYQRLMNAMFLRAVPVQGTSAASITDPEMRAIFEPVLEDFSFITPRDSNAPVYAVSVKYRINGYNRAGQIFDSWTFTGYGSVESSTMGLKGTNALKAATGLAMRDAAAKLAAEFREQAIVRGLLPSDAPLTPVLPPAAGDGSAPAPGKPTPAGETAPAGETTPAGETAPAGEPAPAGETAPVQGEPAQGPPTQPQPAPSTPPPSTPPAEQGTPLAESDRVAA